MSGGAAADHTGDRAGVLQLLLGSFIISFSAVFVKLAHVGPTTSGFYRNFFGGVVLLAIVLARRDSLWRGWRPFGYAALAGLLFAADIFCWHRSIEYIGPGLATIMGNFQVFVLAFVGVLVFRERATWQFFVAIPLAILGLFLLVGVEWSELDALYKTGVWLGVATALTYAGYLLTLRRSQKDIVRLSAMSNLTVVTLVTAGILAVSVRAEGESFAIPDGQTWTVLIALGVFCQALGWIVISQALRSVAASRAGLLLLTQPTLTFIWDILFFGRPTSGVEAVGALLALGAIYLGNSKRA